MAVWFEKVSNWSDGRLDHQSIPLLITPSHTYSSSTTNVIWLNIAMTALMITMSLREKVAYLTEGGEEVEDIKVNYPRFERNQIWLKKTHVNMQGSPSDCPARAQEGRRLREQHERLWNCRRNGKRGQILQKKSSRWSKICFFKKSRLSIPGSKDGVPHLLQPCQGAGEVLHLWTRQGSGYFQVNVFIINCQHTDSPSLLCWLVLTF